jgi:hypothetical protein
MTVVNLIKTTHEHLEMIRTWRMLPEVTKYMYTDPIITKEEQRDWFSKVKSDNSVIYWIIYVDYKPVGLINLFDIDFINSRCAWAYYIGDTNMRGKGIGTLLECNIYDYVFYSLRLNKLWCEVMLSNTKVIDIHKKFGSKVEGVFKEYIIKNGEKLDVVRMAILKTEWDQIRSNYVYEKISIEE